MKNGWLFLFLLSLSFFGCKINLDDINNELNSINLSISEKESEKNKLEQDLKLLNQELEILEKSKTSIFNFDDWLTSIENTISGNNSNKNDLKSKIKKIKSAQKEIEKNIKKLSKKQKIIQRKYNRGKSRNERYETFCSLPLFTKIFIFSIPFLIILLLIVFLRLHNSIKKKNELIAEEKRVEELKNKIPEVVDFIYEISPEFFNELIKSQEIIENIPKNYIDVYEQFSEIIDSKVNDKISLLNEDEKSEYENNVADKKESLIILNHKTNIQCLEEKQNKLNKEYDEQREGKELSQLLKKYKPKAYKKDTSFVGTVISFFDNGREEVEFAEEQFKNIEKVYKSYLTKYEIEKIELDISKFDYQCSVDKVNIFAGQIKSIYDKLSPKERKALLLEVENYDLKENIKIEKATFNEIKSIKTSIDTTNDNFLKHADQIVTKSKTENDLMVGAALLAIEGISNFVENGEKRTEIVKKYSDATKRMMNDIKNIDAKIIQITALCSRLKEITGRIDSALDTNKKTYEIIYKLLYPKNDISKSRVERKKRTDGYFTDEEITLIKKEFVQILKFLMQIVDTKF